MTLTHGSGHLTFNQFWGGLRIRVDGTPIVDQDQTSSVRLTKTWALEVGENKHQVRVVKGRSLFLAGFRSQLVAIFADDQQLAEA